MARLGTSFVPIPKTDVREMKRAEKIAKDYGQSHVVLSFGAQNGGAYFAKWLRWQIMQIRPAYTEPNNVYLDTVALASVPGTVITTKDAARPWLIGVASMNLGWHDYYRHAVAQCHTMIYVGTPEWTKSPWCPGELEDFEKENQARLGTQKKPIQAIVLAMDGHLINVPGAEVIPTSKQDAELAYQARAVVTTRANPGAAATFGGKLKSPELPANMGWGGNYVIDGRALLRVIQLIGRP